MHEEATSNEESWLQKEKKKEGRSLLPSTSPSQTKLHSTEGKGRKKGKQQGRENKQQLVIP
jgi:hypothetical protein